MEKLAKSNILTSVRNSNNITVNSTPFRSVNEEDENYEQAMSEVIPSFPQSSPGPEMDDTGMDDPGMDDPGMGDESMEGPIEEPIEGGDVESELQPLVEKYGIGPLLVALGGMESGVDMSSSPEGGEAIPPTPSEDGYSEEDSIQYIADQTDPIDPMP